MPEVRDVGCEFLRAVEGGGRVEGLRGEGVRVVGREEGKEVTAFEGGEGGEVGEGEGVEGRGA